MPAEGTYRRRYKDAQTRRLGSERERRPQSLGSSTLRPTTHSSKMFRAVFLAVVTVLALSSVASAAPQRPSRHREPMRAIMHDMMEIGMMPLRLTVGAIQGGGRMINRGIVQPMTRGARTLMRAPSRGFRSTFINN